MYGLTPEHAKRRSELIASYCYLESVLDTADMPSNALRGPLWFGWALREAFLAGCSYAKQEMKQ